MHQTGGEPISPDAAAELTASWGAARQLGATAYTPSNLEARAITGWSAVDQQMVEGRQYMATQLARMAGVNPVLVSAATGSSSSYVYTNQADYRQSFLDDVLDTYLQAIEGRLSANDVSPRGQYFAFDRDEFTRLPLLARTQVMVAALKGGDPPALVNQLAQVLDLNIEIPEEDTAPTPPPAGAGPACPARHRRRSTPEVPEPCRSSPAPPGPGSRRTRPARTITGMVVPWGSYARVSTGQTVAFARGSLSLSDRSKLVLDHDPSQPVAVFQSSTDTDQGLEATWRVPAGDRGDQILAEASDGLRDGLSVAADVTASDDRDEGTWVTSARGRHVALLSEPAFDNARVSSVAAASQPTGATMTVTETPTPANVAVEADPVTLTAAGAASAVAATRSCGLGPDPGRLPVRPAARAGRPELRAGRLGVDGESWVAGGRPVA